MTGIELFALVVAVLFAFPAFWLLKNRDWLLGWLRGTLGLVFLLLSLAFLSSVVGFVDYPRLVTKKNVATLSFQRDDRGIFRVNYGDLSGNEQIVEISGDQWHLEARMLYWPTALTELGLPPGYRVERLAGHYLELEKDRRLSADPLMLMQPYGFYDVWQWLYDNRFWFNLLQASRKTVAYLPLVDGALYGVDAEVSGLVIRPLNQRAKLAMQ